MSDPVFAFSDRQTAERLRDYSIELANQVKPLTTFPRINANVGQHRSYWVRPKGVIPAATDPLTPGIGTAYVCFLNRELKEPAIERLELDSNFVEVSVTNYSYRSIAPDPNNNLLPLLRVSEDVFGDLAIHPVGGDEHFIFQLLEDFGNGNASALIYTMEGAPFDSSSVLDPLSIFAELKGGDRGICFLQYGIFYAIQAPCPEDQESNNPSFFAPFDTR
jgi:hypothetical protein